MVNKAILIGNIGKDAETKIFSGDKKLVKFSVATSETYKDKTTGERKTATEWHNIDYFGCPDGLVPYLKKGTSVYVEGKIKTTKTDDGKYFTSVICRELRLLGSGKQSQQSIGAKPEPQTDVLPAVEENNDDLPF